jgi:hypothetical protein
MTLDFSSDTSSYVVFPSVVSSLHEPRGDPDCARDARGISVRDSNFAPPSTTSANTDGLGKSPECATGERGVWGVRCLMGSSPEALER